MKYTHTHNNANTVIVNYMRDKVRLSKKYTGIHTLLQLYCKFEIISK